MKTFLSYWHGMTGVSFVLSKFDIVKSGSKKTISEKKKFSKKNSIDIGKKEVHQCKSACKNTLASFLHKETEVAIKGGHLF